jgi:hypothetical protein
MQFEKEIKTAAMTDSEVMQLDLRETPGASKQSGHNEETNKQKEDEHNVTASNRAPNNNNVVRT